MIPHIDINKYTYDLPETRIARYPLERRDMSKLLVYNGAIGQSVFSNITDYIPDGAMLIFNNTKVIRARLRFSKDTGAAIEVFCLEPVSPSDVQVAFAARRSTVWRCIVGNSKKWKSGTLAKVVTTDVGRTTVTIGRGEAVNNSFDITFSWDNDDVTFADIIESAGVTPIPPYLNRDSEDVDIQRYQTVYSSQKGSVAAPTAGLHFTPEILERIRRSGCKIQELTLHVGAGTFKPVQTDDAASHVMHIEHFIVDIEAVRNIISHKGPFVTVGTTSVRTAESLYWLGVRLLHGLTIDDGVGQWDAYNLNQNYSLCDALNAIMNYMEERNISHFQSQTAIMIMPGYKFRVADVLITNFHQPHSTLLLLIGAFIGDDWHNVYDYALANDFRFLSYGDSSILFRK